MKKIVRITFKILGISLVAIFALTASVYIYFKVNLDEYINSKEVEFVIASIKKSKNLPENFYKAYEQKYPGSLSAESNVKYDHSYPSVMVQDLIYPAVLKTFNASIPNLIARYFILEKIKAETTQRQCLNWLFEERDFLSGNIGSERASLHYFGEDIHELNEDEVAVIIDMFDNASFYNPMRKK